MSDDYDKKYFINIDNAIKKLENKEYSLNKIERVLKEIDNIKTVLEEDEKRQMVEPEFR